MRLALAAAGLLALPAAALAQTPPPPLPRVAAPLEAVSVTGEGRATLTPDRVTFTAGVETVAPKAALAVEENNRLISAVVAALKRAGAADREIRTSQLALFPQMDPQPGRRPRIVGYQVTNTVTVTRDEVGDVGALLQAAIDAGANQVSGVRFVVADPARGRDEGLREAFADARAKAQVLAQAAGRTVGRAVAITEGGAPDRPVPMDVRTMAMEARAMPVEPGTEELRYTVSVTFELR